MKYGKPVKHALLRDVNIWIDSYEDLFSDFDPRPFTERAVSDDFISEMNKFTEEKDERVRTLRFQIPEKMRDEKAERIIINRLTNDFRREYLRFAEEVKTGRRRAFFIALFGMISLMIALIFTTAEGNKLGYNLLRTIFEPAGWFMVWTGLDKLFFGGKNQKRKRNFYERLEKCKVEFDSIEVGELNVDERKVA